MGNTAIKEDGTIVGEGTMHSNMMRMMKDDVFKKYKVVEVLGSGSMGFVAKAQLRDKAVGGSAVKRQSKMEKMTEKVASLGLKKSSKHDTKISDRRESPALYALKSIQVDRVSEMFLEELRNEMNILRRLDHPNIVKAYEVFHNKRQIYMVLELCDGGDLYTRAPYSEEESCVVVGQLLSAIKYMVSRT